jgi:hypothetical protein
MIANATSHSKVRQRIEGETDLSPEAPTDRVHEIALEDITLIDRSRKRQGRPMLLNSRIVASLDRKRLGADFCGGAGYRTEAFSIRRLGGSRWRLRRTRCAMGFERQRGSEQGLGRAARRGGNAVRIVGMVLKMSESVCGKWPERRWRGGGHTSAPACGSTSLGRQWWTRYEESK